VNPHLLYMMLHDRGSQSLWVGLLESNKYHRSSHVVPVRFLMMWRRESKERGRCHCFANQPPLERNNHLMRQLHNHCMSCCCHATHNILFYIHKLRNYIALPDDLLPDNSLYMLLLSRPKIMHGTAYETTQMYLPWPSRPRGDQSNTCSFTRLASSPEPKPFTTTAL
jgi:hypothetical protein